MRKNILSNIPISAGIYIRVSTEEQKNHGLSIQQQFNDIAEWAKENQIYIYDWYSDEGASASNINRPELERLLFDVQAGRINKIICTKLDRLARKLRDYYKLMDIIEPYGCTWQAIQEEYDTETTNGQFLINIKLAMAEAELSQTSDRVKTVLKGKKMRGEPVNGAAPMGYKIINKKFEIDEEIADITRTYINCYLQQGSLSAGYRAACELGYNFTLETYRKMLRNPMYMGQLYGVDNMCPALISKDTFEKIQKSFTLRKYTPTNKPRIYLFTGLLICADCGRRYVSGYNQYKRKDGTIIEYNIYNCSEFRRKGTVANCHNNSIKESDIEHILLEQLFRQNYSSLDILERKEIWQKNIEHILVYPKEYNPRIKIFFK